MSDIPGIDNRCESRTIFNYLCNQLDELFKHEGIDDMKEFAGKVQEMRDEASNWQFHAEIEEY